LRNEDAAMRASITDVDLVRMRDGLFFEGETRSSKLSRFWALLILSAVIASAGVVGDSTATVIGAMIVAPLMIPILGTVLSIVTADRVNLIRSLALVVGGALAAIGVGWLMGLASPIDVVAATSSQVAGRVSPRLIDLVAALATGAVGAFALCREDVSDTLPGVAIAISLVPPLAVVGLTLEARAYDESAGALLLFTTNVAAILVSGCVLMALYGVFAHSTAARTGSFNRRRAILWVAMLGALIVIPLTSATISRTRENHEENLVYEVADQWATDAGWYVEEIERESGDLDVMTVTIHGPTPGPDASSFRNMLDSAGLGYLTVRVRLMPEAGFVLTGG
jgi:uncharacterized hydrophobic protein (TIGR00271 family)